MNAELSQQILEASETLKTAHANVGRLDAELGELRERVKEKEKERADAQKQLEEAKKALCHVSVGEGADGPSHWERIRR